MSFWLAHSFRLLPYYALPERLSHLHIYSTRLWSQFASLFYCFISALKFTKKSYLWDFTLFAFELMDYNKVSTRTYIFHCAIFTFLEHCSLCTIFTILLTFSGKSCNAHMLHASGVYYSYMVSGPNFEFRKVIRNFWHQDTCF